MAKDGDLSVSAGGKKEDFEAYTDDFEGFRPFPGSSKEKLTC